MRRSVKVLVFGVILPGALALALLWGLYMLTVGAVAKRARALNWTPSRRVLFWSRVWCAWYRVPWDLHLSILRREGASSPSPAGRYPVGDTSARRGPAIGPGQVLKARITRLWTWGRRLTFKGGDWDDGRIDEYRAIPAFIRAFVVKSDPLELANVGAELASTWASVVILREALDEMKGDEFEAARRYNGFGDPARAYARKVYEFRDELNAA